MSLDRLSFESMTRNVLSRYLKKKTGPSTKSPVFEFFSKAVQVLGPESFLSLHSGPKVLVLSPSTKSKILSHP